jgi:hypothetical protein
VQVNESLLKGVLHDILGVFSHTSHAPRNEENSLLVTLDQNFKRWRFPPFAAATRVGSPSSGGLSTQVIAARSL